MMALARSGQSGSGGVAGFPNLVLRAEGAALLCVSLALYFGTGMSWWLFAILFLAPDVFMLGYLANSRTGAALYNLGHTTLLPLGLIVAGWWGDQLFSVGIGFIWLGHIGFDRMLGYGLKYGGSFHHSHLSTGPQD
jgi:hypothetical protein